MKSTLAVVTVLSFLAAGCAESPVMPNAPSATRPSLAAIAPSDGDSIVQGKFLVRASGGGFPSDFAAQVQALGGTVTFAHQGAGIAAVSGLSDAAAAQLAKVRGIGGVDDDNFTTVDLPTGFETAAADGAVASASDPTSATWFARQWNMRQVNAPAAWAAGRLGNSTTRVGILDTGLDYTHPDLAGRVDLANSVSFDAFDDLFVGFFFPGANPVADLHFHGTHVGSTVVSNGVVTAGIMSGATLVGIKVCSFFGSCPTSQVLQGILYAADLGLPVANMSLGGSFQRKQASARGGVGPSFIATINAVFTYANRKGTVMVVSAGNSSADLDHDGNGYKAYCSAPNVVCVSATGPTAAVSVNGPWTAPDAPAYYTNFGTSSVSVAAPGGSTGASVWASCSRFSLQIPVCQTGTFILGLRGTSMAAPHVTGTAALISEDVGANPGLIRARLQQSADDLGAPGADPYYGKGRINVGRAVGQ